MSETVKGDTLNWASRTMDSKARQAFYMSMYEHVSFMWNRVPDATEAEGDIPEDASVEWHLFNALDNGLHTVMDTLAALVDVTEDDAA